MSFHDSYEGRLCETPVHPKFVEFVEHAKQATEGVELEVKQSYKCQSCNGQAVAYRDAEGKIHARCSGCGEGVN